MIADPTKANQKGEDAMFASQSAIGIADGVGAWSSMGIDAGLFARQLMNGARDAVEKDGMFEPTEIIRTALDRVTCPGTSTACIVLLCDSGSLEAANLGDSVFMVIDSSARSVLFKCPEQQHLFNYPFQLSADPATPSPDTPDDALRVKIPVEEGDLVVLASDGLWDNVYDSEILKACREELNLDGKQKQVGKASAESRIAKKLARLAHKHARDMKRQSPFGVRARTHGKRHAGGKMDDVTVVSIQFRRSMIRLRLFPSVLYLHSSLPFSSPSPSQKEGGGDL